MKINKDNFQKLLNWLDSDIEKSAEKYSHIHSALIKIFYTKGFQNGEELADQTIDRVAEKIEKLTVNYEGEKSKYFFGVAKFIIKENFRKNTSQPVILELQDNIGFVENSYNEVLADHKFECLKKCIGKLTEKNRKLVLEYYAISDSERKIEKHRKLAKKNSLSVNALRVQTFRIKKKLEECVVNCEKNGNSM